MYCPTNCLRVRNPVTYKQSPANARVQKQSPRNILQSRRRVLTNKAVADDALSGIAQRLPLAEISPEVIPFAALGALGVTVVGTAALRAYCYGQVEFVTAAMLSRNLQQAGNIRIIQLGGGTRELYYYPKSTIQVTVVGEDLDLNLYEQAGIQAAVPVVCRKDRIEGIADMGGSAADAIVCLASLHEIDNLVPFFNTVYRLLKPGGRFIFVQAVASGGASPTQTLAGTASEALELTKLDPLKSMSGFSSVVWDVANEGLDPHVVGLAIKSTTVKSTKKRK